MVSTLVEIECSAAAGRLSVTQLTHQAAQAVQHKQIAEAELYQAHTTVRELRLQLSAVQEASESYLEEVTIASSELKRLEAEVHTATAELKLLSDSTFQAVLCAAYCVLSCAYRTVL